MSTPWFSKEEYNIRYEKARKLMDEKSLDALFATEVINYTYLGGHVIPGLNSTTWKSRPYTLILPKKGEPIITGQSGSKNQMLATSWIKNIKSWKSMPMPIDPLLEAFRELDLTDGRIGCEFSSEERLGIAYNDLVSLMKSFPQAEFVDGSDVFWRLRVIKSDAEIACLKKACDVTSIAYEKTFSTIERGMSREAVKKIMLDYMSDEGLEPGFSTPNFFPAETSFCMKNGDTIFIDAGAVCKGYHNDFSRVVAVGAASDKVKKLYKTMREITWKLMAMVKAGVKTADIAKACIEEHKKAGLSQNKMDNTGRVGHGIGLGNSHPYFFSTELPSINATDPTVLEPNMVITLEPGERTSYGYFTLEENFVVKEDGYEILSLPVSDEDIREI